MNKPLLLERRRTCRDILRLTSWGCVSAIDSNGRTIWIADAHRGDGKRFIVHADEKLTAFLELESAICAAERQRIAERREIKLDKLSRIK